MQRAVRPSWGRLIAFQDGHFWRRPSTPRRRQIGRPNARPRTGCIARRTSFLSIVFKVLRLVYYSASVGADFYSFSYLTSCDLVARDQNLSPLAQHGFWRWLPAGHNRLCLHSCSIVCLVIQGSYTSWKTLNILEFDKYNSRPWIYWNFVRGPWKYWNISLFWSGFSTMFIFVMTRNYCSLIILCICVIIF